MLVRIRTSTPAPLGESRGLPLVDPQARQIRYLRLSLTDRCNYRCTYCMPEEGVPHHPRGEVLSLEEMVRLVAAFAAMGVERVRLTGGEPTVRRGLTELVAALASLRTSSGARLEVVMTTNGELLEELAGPLARSGLAGLTVSLDSLDAARFSTITRRGELARVLAGIEAAQAAGLPLKLNTVAIRGFNDDELGAIAAFAWARGVTPRFIEVMPMAGGRLYVPGALLPAAEIRAAVAAGAGAALVADTGEGVRGLGPATYWRASAGRWAGHRVGVIAAMTENFCGSCNRLRVSASGQLHACLARDEAGDLRAALRSDDPQALERAVRAVVGSKRDGHLFGVDGSGGPRKAMVSIGG
ncbi:MAG: GTP 3',8-cyclase MoaA [Nannocystis sp.]|nr:GTP 3',8-cyclase MoaA [Nannocystis sp.]